MIDIKGVSLPCSHARRRSGSTHDGIQAVLLCLRQNRATFIACAFLPSAKPLSLHRLRLPLLRSLASPGRAGPPEGS